MQLVNLYVVEIGDPEDYEKLRKLANRLGGTYVPSERKYHTKGFMFASKKNAEKFLEASKHWPQSNHPFGDDVF